MFFDHERLAILLAYARYTSSLYVPIAFVLLNLSTLFLEKERRRQRGREEGEREREKREPMFYDLIFFLLKFTNRAFEKAFILTFNYHNYSFSKEITT